MNRLGLIAVASVLCLLGLLVSVVLTSRHGFTPSAAIPKGTGELEVSAYVADVSGPVEYRRPGDARWKPVKSFQSLPVEGELRTGEGGRLDLVVDRTVGVRAGGSTEFRLSSFHSATLMDRRLIRLGMDKGKIISTVRRDGKGPRVRVETPSASVTVKGTIFMVTAHALQTRTMVLDGLVEVSSPTQPSKKVLVGTGEGVEVGSDFAEGWRQSDSLPLKSTPLDEPERDEMAALARAYPLHPIPASRSEVSLTEAAPGDESSPEPSATDEAVLRGMVHRCRDSLQNLELEECLRGAVDRGFTLNDRPVSDILTAVRTVRETITRPQIQLDRVEVRLSGDRALVSFLLRGSAYRVADHSQVSLFNHVAMEFVRRDGRWLATSARTY